MFCGIGSGIRLSGNMKQPRNLAKSPGEPRGEAEAKAKATGSRDTARHRAGGESHVGVCRPEENPVRNGKRQEEVTNPGSQVCGRLSGGRLRP